MEPIRPTLILTTLALALSGCGVGTSSPAPLPTLDLEAAIDNPRTFDLTEIATEIEFIPLDDTNKEGLVGDITKIDESQNRIYVMDGIRRETPLKVFDRTGRFLTTRGRFGRGPGEYTGISSFAVDPATDNLHMDVMASMEGTLIVYDPSGRELTRRDSVTAGTMVIHDGKLLLHKSNMNRIDGDDDLSATGIMKPFIDIYSPADLRHEATIEAPDRGLTFTIQMVSEGYLNITLGPNAILSSDGSTMWIKEAFSDTLKTYRSGTLEPAFIFDSGAYTIPDGAFGMDPSTELGNSYAIRDVLGNDGYIFVEAHGYRDDTTARLLFDLNDPSSSFSALGPDGRHGFFLDGILFRPMYIRDGRLVGWMQALDIADAAQNGATITNPRLKTLATTIKEDSNPIIVIVTLKKQP